MTKKPSRDGRDNREMNKRQMMMAPPKIIDVKIEKVELHHTENAWRPAKYNANEAPNGDGQVGQSFQIIIELIPNVDCLESSYIRDP